MGNYYLQTEQVIVEIATFFLLFFPSSCQLLEQSTSVLWEGKEYTNICHQKYAAIKGKSLCVTAINQWQRAEKVSAMALMPTFSSFCRSEATRESQSTVVLRSV